MKHINLTSANYLAGSGIIAGVLAAGSSAQAQVIVQHPDYSITLGGSDYFNVESSPATFNSGDDGNEFSVTAGKSGLTTYSSSVDGEITGANVTAALPFDSSIGSGSTFSAETILATGDNYYGFEVPESDGTHYGYFELDLDPGVLSDNLSFDTVTINTIAYDTVSGQSIFDVPEPASSSLLAAAAAGAAGLALYRRMRARAASVRAI